MARLRERVLPRAFASPRPNLGVLGSRGPFRGIARSATRALTGDEARRSFLSTAPRDRLAYLAFLVLMVVTALPFMLAQADGRAAGVTAIPAVGIWDAIGRARMLALSGPLPLVAGPGPESPVWTWAVAALYWPIAWTGLSIALVAKGLGWLAAFAAVSLLYNLAYFTTGRRWPAVLGVTLVLLDPILAVGRVSGSESPLFLAVLAFGCLAVVRGRLSALAWTLPVLLLLRSDGAAFVGLVVVVLAFNILWRSGEPPERPAGHIATFARLLLPTAVALALWVLFELIVSGRLPPPPVTAVGVETSLGQVWRVVLDPHPSFGTGLVILTLGGWIWSTRLFVRRWGIPGIVPSLIPWLSLWTWAATVAWSDDSLTSESWRLIEPAFAWFDLALAIGLVSAAEVIWRNRRAGLTIGAGSDGGFPTERLIAIVPLLLWLLTALPLWLRAPSEFAWGARNVSELPAAAGAWLAANAPPGALVGLASGTEPVRALAQQRIRPLPPLPSHAAARQIEVQLREEGLAYVVAYRSSPIADWGLTREVARFVTPRPVGLPGSELLVLQIDWNTPRVAEADPIDLQVAGFTVVDMLDIGDHVSETAHFYAATTPGREVWRQVRGQRGWLFDDGRAQTQERAVETFTLRARPGADLILGIRYDRETVGALRVDVGRAAFDWRPRSCEQALCEDALVIPGGQVAERHVRIAVSFAPSIDSPGARLGTYRYWSIVRQGDA